MRRPLNRLANSPGLCPLIVTAIILLAMLLSPAWQIRLEFQHQSIGNGELWRLITGHLVHLSWGHLLMNLLGFWLIWELFLRFELPLTTCAIGLSLLCLGTSAGLYLFSPNIEWYRGLSGVLHGLLIWSLLKQLKLRPLSHAILLGLVMVKLAWEQASGPLPGSETMVTGRIIVDAHLYGALSGALLWALEQGMRKLTSEVVK